MFITSITYFSKFLKLLNLKNDNLKRSKNKVTRNSEKQIRIYGFINQIDWFSFNQIYCPILSPKAYILFMNLVHQHQINTYLGCQEFLLKTFLNNYQLKEQELEEYLIELKNIDLIKITCKILPNFSPELGIKIIPIEKIETIFKNCKLREILEKSVSSEKFEELRLISNEQKEYDGYEITLNSEFGKIKSHRSSEILDKKIYSEFYNGVLKKLNKEFSINDEVLRLINKYNLKEQKISMEKLQTFASLSAILNKEKNKYEISDTHFMFLIDQEINKPLEKFDLKKNKEFWKKILIKDDEHLISEYKTLFGNYKWEDLYKFLTSKYEIPITLKKLINDCIRYQKFSYPVINGVLSFIFCLLNKIPVNYISKVFDTLKKENSISAIGLIDLARSVIHTDLSKNKNRLEAYTPKENNESEESNFVTYFDPKSM